MVPMAESKSEGSGSSADWDRVDRLIFSWLDQPDDVIGQHLGELRGEDPALAEAVASRLNRVRQLGRVLGQGEPESGPRVGATFGDYRIERVLGQGGMGAVYLAEQLSLGRRVALKVIRNERLRDPGARQRFRREARAVADLRHPGICAVLDVGEVEATPYLAMQYVDGETLAERLASRRNGRQPDPESRPPSTAADIAAVLRLIEQVAHSLHVAHEAGVVHRDVKPGNVMIDRDGQPVVLDFGLAHVEAQEHEPTLTLTGDQLGTPAYMSPEQVRPQGRTIDRRTDVYSLAVTLYECLTLERPFTGSSQVALFERIERDPTPDPRRRNPHLPADLSAVLAKAMEKEPARRYATAQDLAADLQRIRAHQPVHARRIGPGQRLWRWCQRNPWAAALLLVLAAGLGTTGALWRQTSTQHAAIARLAEDSRVQALIGAATTEAAIDPMLSLRLALAAADARRTPATLERVRSSLLVAAEKSLLLGHRNHVTRSQLSRDGALALTGSEDGTVRVWDQDGRERQAFDFGAVVTGLALEPAARRALCTTSDGKLRVLDLEARTEKVVFATAAPAWCVQPLADGRYACGSGDGMLRIFSADDRLQRSYEHGSQVWVVATSRRNARFVATSDFDGVVRVFDLESESQMPCLQVPTGSIVDCIRFSPRRDEILLVDRMGRIMVCGVQDLAAPPIARCRHGQPGARIHDAVWAPDGERFLTAAVDYYGRLWRRDGTLETVLGGHTGEVFQCAVAADGTYWATAGDDATIRVWTARGGLLTVLRGHSSAISGGLEFSGDGRTLLSGATDSTARLWDLTSEGSPILMSPTGSFTRARFVPAGATEEGIVAATKDGRIVFGDRAGAKPQDLALPIPTWVASIAIDAARQRLVVGQFEGWVHVVDLAQRKVIRSWRNPERHDPASRIAVVDAAGNVLLAKCRWLGHPATLAWTDLELSEPRRIATLPADYTLHAATLDPTGQRIYLAGGDGSIRIYSREGVAGPIAVPPTGNGILGLDFSPDGKVLGTTCNDRIARLYDVAADGSLHARAELEGHENDVLSLHFTPDGKQVVTASRDATVRVWSAAGAQQATIRGHAGFVYDAVFSADGRTILSCGSEGTARLWHADPDAMLAAARARLRRGFDAEERRRYGALLEPLGR